MVDVIAFHALLGHSIDSPSQNQEINFDNVITNIGNAYHGLTGTFTCKQPGTYVFSWSVDSTMTHFVYTHLVKNGAVVGSVITNSGISWGTGSGMVVIELDTDDHVWVKVGAHDTGTYIWSDYSMFSGFML